MLAQRDPAFLEADAAAVPAARAAARTAAAARVAELNRRIGGRSDDAAAGEPTTILVGNQVAPGERPE